MVISFKGKNLTEAMKKMQTVTPQQVSDEIKEQITISERDMLCLISLYQFLKDKHKSKIFLTTEDSIVWKDRTILRKLHKIRITTLEKLRKRKII